MAQNAYADRPGLNAARLRGVITYITIMSLAMALSAVSAQAQDCNVLNVRPMDGPAGYAARSGDRRCEGFYESLISSGSLEIVSATIGDPPPADAKSLWLYVPGLKPGGAARLHAQALAHRTYYRMDARIDAGQSLVWPLSDVVIPSGLDAGSIGVLARIQEGHDQVVVPVAIGTSSDAAPEVGSVRIVFRSDVDLDGLVWRLTPSGQPVGDWRDADRPGIAVGETRVVLIEPMGDVLLEFRGRPAGTVAWIGGKTRIRLPK